MTIHTPWHALGTPLEYDVPLLSEEALKQGGLDWKVRKLPIIAVDPDDGSSVGFTNEFFANTRETDGAILGVVGTKYQVLQNSDAFTFMDRAAGAENLMVYEACGVFQEGKQIWLVGKLIGLTIAPVPGDECQLYALLAHGHDGRLALRSSIVLNRPACSNAIVMALKSSKNGLTIRHTGDMKSKIAAAEKVMKMARREYEEFGRAAQALAQIQIGVREWDLFLDDLVGELKEDTTARLKNQRDELTRLFEEGEGTDIPGVKGTAWGALNAVTAWTTHTRATRGHGGNDAKASEKRLESVLFGTGNDLNQKAMSLLLA